MANPNMASFVVHTLSCDYGAPPEKFGDARRYESKTTVATEIHRVWDHHIKTTLYEILPRPSTSGAKQYSAAEFDNARLLSGGIAFNLPTPTGVREQLLMNKFKHSYTPSWEHFDFSGMVYHLAAWLAYCTWMPGTALSAMAGGRIKLLGMNNPEEIYALTDSRVYIHQAVSASGHAATFWALAWAAAATGATVLTDYVCLATDYSVKVDVTSGGAAWFGAVEALAILAEVYAQAGCADIFAVYMTAGFHSVQTVVGHSDEGGVVRDIIRRVRWTKSFGGLPRASVRSNSIPCLASNPCYEALTNIVDAYTLLSAAAVAHCDPLCDMGREGLFPTVLDCGDVTGAADRTRFYGEIIQQGFPVFCDMYAKALAKLVGSSECDSQGRGAAVLRMAAQEMFSHDYSRHLDHPVVAPYYWIEPTGLIPRGFFGTPAEDMGWASLGARDDKTTMRPFERMERAGRHTDNWSDWIVDCRGARSSGLILFLQNHWRDGLAHVIPLQFNASNICLSGCHGTEDAAREAGAHIGEYLWTRGQSAFPHPAEFLNIKRNMMVRVVHYTSDGVTTRLAPNVPMACDFEHAQYTLTFNRISQIAPGKPNAGTARTRRDRKVATEALSKAAMAVYTTLGPRYTTNFTADCVPAFGSHSVSDPTGGTMVGGFYDCVSGENITQQTVVKHKTMGVPKPTIHHEPQRGPQPVRADSRPVGVTLINREDSEQPSTLGLETTYRTAASSEESSTVIPVANLAGGAPTQGAQPAAHQ